MKAFITGATGFLGTHLVFELIEAGWDLCILKRTNSDISEFKDLDNIRYVEGDITDKESLRNGMPNDVDVVFHVAGSVAHLPHHLEKTRYKINVLGTRNMVDIALEKKIPKFIYTSTVLVYDFRAKDYFDEKNELNEWCRDPYIHSKKLAEEEIYKGINNGLNAIIMQPSAVFGSYDKATWSKMFLEVQRGLPLPFAPPGGGSVCHARAVARAHINAATKGSVGDKYILGGPFVTWMVVLKKVAKLLAKKEPKWVLPRIVFKTYGWLEFLCSTYLLKRDPTLTPHAIDILCEKVSLDSSKAEIELDYKSPTIDEMLMDCYQWMKRVKMLA